MTRTFFMVLSILLHSTNAVHETYVDVQLWTAHECRGDTDTFELDWTCYYFPNWGTELSSARILEGSCVKLHRGFSCEREVFTLGYPHVELCGFPAGFNDQVASVGPCDLRRVDVLCPPGSYMRQIVHGTANEDITVHCYRPGDSTPIYSGNTHGKNPSNPILKSCPVVPHKLEIEWDENWRIFHTPSFDCNKRITKSLKPNRIRQGAYEHKNTTIWVPAGNTLANECVEGEALGGISVELDDVGVIKALGYYCNPILDPASMCEPKESLGIVVQCDNSDSGNEIECSYSRTIGVGESKTMTDTERRELTFHQEFGFEIGADLFGLSAKMSASLGYSELVGYEWSQSDTVTWSVETTVTATIKVRPYAHSKLEQLIGKCSFYGTSTNYFKQTDINVKTGEKTIKFFSF